MKILKTYDQNMFGGMCQHSFMDYQDEVRALSLILSKSVPEIHKAFFIVELSIELIDMLCTEPLTFGK